MIESFDSFIKKIIEESSKHTHNEFYNNAFQAIKNTFKEKVDLRKISIDYLENYIDNYPESMLFSDRSARVFTCDDYFIDIYKWDETVTSIHDHNFEGAFVLLDGESIQVEFRHQLVQEISHDVEIVNLSKSSITRIKPGDAFKIKPFSRFVHNIFHRPVSLTMCIRTHPKGYLKSYFYPSIGFNYKKEHFKIFEDLRLSEGQWEENNILKILDQLDLCGLLRFLRFYPNWKTEVIKRIESLNPDFSEIVEETISKGRIFEKKLNLLKKFY